MLAQDLLVLCLSRTLGRRYAIGLIRQIQQGLAQAERGLVNVAVAQCERARRRVDCGELVAVRGLGL